MDLASLFPHRAECEPLAKSTPSLPVVTNGEPKWQKNY